MTCERVLAVINPFSKVKMSSSSYCRLPRSLCKNTFTPVVRIPSSLPQAACIVSAESRSFLIIVSRYVITSSKPDAWACSGASLGPQEWTVMVIHSREWHFANSIFFCHTYTLSGRSYNTWANLFFLRFLAPLRWAKSQNFLPRLCF